MSLSEESAKAARDHVQWILENQCRIPIRATTPIGFYYKTANNLIDEADHFYRANQWEQSFILYSRYITLFVEELKQHHPGYANVPVIDRERIKEVMRSKALPRAEELKVKLKEKYARDYEEKHRTNEEHEDNIKLSAGLLGRVSTDIHQENELALRRIQASHVEAPPAYTAFSAMPTVDNTAGHPHPSLAKPTYDRSRKPLLGTSQTGMAAFRRVALPHDITAKFLQVAQRNTDRQIETCGILAGNRAANNQYVITDIVVPKQNGGPDSCDTEKEEEVVEYIANKDLITLGWIHTHPTQTAFLSSVDLHTHLPYQMLMQESIAIVISPKYNETGIFSLTPETGIPVISTCKKSGFHEHINNPPLYVTSTHTSYDHDLQCRIVDLR